MKPAILLFAATLACGSSGKAGGALDCAWVQSNNCWKTTIAAAVSCLPAGTGTFSADLMSCSWTDGHALSSDLPLTTLGNPMDWVITENGTQCIHWMSGSGSGVDVTTSAGTVSITNDGTTAVVTCPDGSMYTSSDATAFQACAGDAGIAALPGSRKNSGTGSNGSNASFTIDGTASGGVQAWDCSM